MKNITTIIKLAAFTLAALILTGAAFAATTSPKDEIHTTSSN